MTLIEWFCDLRVTPLPRQNGGEVIRQKVMERLPVLRIEKPVPNRDELLPLMIDGDGRAYVPELANALGLLPRLLSELLEEFDSSTFGNFIKRDRAHIEG